MAEILDTILESIRETPIVRLSRIARDCECEVLAKCEFLNAGGSVKDRIAVRMIEEAETKGLIKPGDTLIEPTSGNTGIGLALAAAIKGYRMIITMPEKMSREKQVILEALGAEIIRTPTEAAFDAPESHIGVAKRLREVIPHSHILDQYGNPNNPLAHYYGTGAEIVRQLDGKLDVFVASAGTGGTLTGIARRLREDIPGCKIIGVDPEGSILAGPSDVKPYKVEGIGYDFIPDVLDRSLVDEWIRTNDHDSFLTARKLIRQEGLLVGGSCGSAVWATLQVARDLGPGKRILTILPDSVRNYMTKFVDPQWMRENGFVEREWANLTVGEIVRSLPRRDVITAQVGESLGDTVQVMKSRGISQVPVLDEGKLVGILTESDVLTGLVTSQFRLDSRVAEAMNRQVVTMHEHDSAVGLPELFSEGEVAIIVGEKHEVTAVVTKIDFVDYLTRARSLQEATGLN